MGTIHVTDYNGVSHPLKISTGEKVMEVIRDAGFPIEAICGGEGACATCHVHVASQWYDRLPKANQKELDFIEIAMTYEPGMSRLSCQISYTEEYDGLEITITDEDD